MSEMRGSSWLKIIVVILSAGILVVSGLYINLFYQQGYELRRRREELKALTEKYDRLVGIPDLLNITIKKPVTRYSSGLIIVSGYNLEYRYDKNNEYVWYENSATALYSPLDNLTLEMYLTIKAPEGIYMSLTIQKGNAFFNESGVFRYKSTHANITVWRSPVIWSVNASESRAYHAVLPSKGWYTLSLIGPIDKASTGALWYRDRGFGGYELWQTVESMRAYGDFRLYKNTEPVLFAISKRWY